MRSRLLWMTGLVGTLVGSGPCGGCYEYESDETFTVGRDAIERVAPFSTSPDDLCANLCTEVDAGRGGDKLARCEITALDGTPFRRELFLPTSPSTGGMPNSGGSGGGAGGVDAGGAAGALGGGGLGGLAPQPPITIDEGESGALLRCQGTYEMCATGRKHADWLPVEQLEASGSFDSWLAFAVYSETASVASFRRLRRELRAHGAPRELLQRLTRAAREECGHARLLRAFAEARGVRVPEVRLAPPSAPRSLYELALENELEGCSAETFVALSAVHQSRAATDERFREAMARIGQEEVGHAALAWDLHDWFMAQLSAEERALIRAERDARWDSILREASAPSDPRLGLPNQQTAASFVAALRAAA